MKISNSLKKFIAVSCLFSSATFGMVRESCKQLSLKHIKRSASELYKETDAAFKDRPIKQLCAPLEQIDKFSCGYRTFFHAKCIDIALQRARNGLPLMRSLQELLRNAGILNHVHERIKNFLDTKHASFDQTIGIDVTHIPGICAEKFPYFYGTILPIMLENDGTTITVLHDSEANPDKPLLYTEKFVEECGRQIPYENCKKIIDSSGELMYQLAKLHSPHSIAHFACRFPKHLFLASMVTDENCKATLYVIDSNNISLSDHPCMKTFVTKLLTYVEQHNAKYKRQKIK